LHDAAADFPLRNLSKNVNREKESISRKFSTKLTGIRKVGSLVDKIFPT
jgi:hypothetical protein